MSQQPQGPQQPNAANQLLTLPGFGGPDDPGLGGAPPSTPWWRQRRTIIIVAIILLLVILGAIILPLLNRKPAVAYQYQHPKTGDLAISISATGPLQSAIYNLTFFNTGSGSSIINEIDVKVGQKVKAGQILAKLNKTALQDAYDQQVIAVQNAQNNLAASSNSLSKAQAAANASNTNAQTTVNNSNSSQGATNNVSSATINSDQSALDSANTALSQTRAQANAQIQQANAQLQVSLKACTPASAPVGAGTPTPTPSDPTACKNLAQATHDAAVAAANTSITNDQTTVNNAQSKLNLDRASTNLSNTTANNTVNSSNSGSNVTKTSGDSSVASSQAQVTTASGNLRTAQALLVQAQHNLDNAILKAPHDGTITTINGSVGGPPGTPPNASTASTTTTNSTFIQLVDTATMQVVANVNETDTANLKVGEPAQFTVNAYGNRNFSGVVSSISPNGQTVSNVVSYPVYIDVDNKSAQGANLYPNMTANVNITVLQRTSVLEIPVDAINFARLASGSNGTAGAATGAQPLVTRQSANAAMAQARQLLTAVQSQRDVSADNPIPAYVIEPTSNGQFAAKPVVLGLTDGTVYEVLDGVTADDTIVIGTSTGTNARGAAGATG